jgi:branched-chain amino acid transport system permease protein
MDILIFFVGVLTLAGFYAIISMLLNIEAGWAGMWDLGLAGLLAVGAYTYVLTTQTQITIGLSFAPQWPMWSGIVASGVMTGVAALVIGSPALRVRGEYFLITTLAFAEVIHQLAINLTTVTRGTVGFSQLQRPFASLASGREYRFVLLSIVLVVAILVYGLSRRIGLSPYGRLLRALRDNEGVALSLGKHISRYRIQTFVLVGVLFGLTAPIYVWYIRSMVPQLFAPDITFTTWTALVIGGVGSFRGPALGAALLLLLTETLQFVQGSAEYATLLASTRPIILGVLLIAVMRWRPQGLVAERTDFKGVSQRVFSESITQEQTAPSRSVSGGSG